MAGSKSQSKAGAKKATAGSPAPKPSAAALKGITTPVKKPGAKDSRDKVFVKGHLSGIVVAYIVDGKHADREAFKAHDMSELHNDPDLLAQLGFNAIVPRKGSDGETPMKQNATSEYNWRQFIALLGEDNNNEEGRRALANKLIVHLNKNANSDNYRYPRKVRFGGDLTASPKTACNESMLDADVVAFIITLYPDNDLEDLAEWDDIVSQFFVDVEDGKAVMCAASADVDNNDTA